MRYAAFGTLVFLAAMLLPVVFALKSSIVEHKRIVSSSTRPTGWKRYYVDVLLLLISGYGIYTYRIRRQTLFATQAIAAELPVDPLLFGISVTFILGSALFALRLFPPALRLLHRVAGSRLPAPFFAALIHA